MTYSCPDCPNCRKPFLAHCRLNGTDSPQYSLFPKDRRPFIGYVIMTIWNSLSHCEWATSNQKFSIAAIKFPYLIIMSVDNGRDLPNMKCNLPYSWSNPVKSVAAKETPKVRLQESRNFRAAEAVEKNEWELQIEHLFNFPTTHDLYFIVLKHFPLPWRYLVPK